MVPYSRLALAQRRNFELKRGSRIHFRYHRRHHSNTGDIRKLPPGHSPWNYPRFQSDFYIRKHAWPAPCVACTSDLAHPRPSTPLAQTFDGRPYKHTGARAAQRWGRVPCSFRRTSSAHEASSLAQPSLHRNRSDCRQRFGEVGAGSSAALLACWSGISVAV